MPEQTGYFIIKPNDKLRGLLDKYNHEEFRHTIIWSILETSDYVGDRSVFFAPYIKLAFLADIIQKFDLPAIQKLHPDFIKIMYEIFGNPPKFHIATLDDWWIFERIDGAKSFRYVIDKSFTKTLRQIEETGIKDLDDMLGAIIKNRKDSE